MCLFDLFGTWTRPRLGGLPYLGTFTWQGNPSQQTGQPPKRVTPSKRDQDEIRDYMNRSVTPPGRVTSPTRGSPPPCEQALSRLSFLALRSKSLLTYRRLIKGEFTLRSTRSFVQSAMFNLEIEAVGKRVGKGEDFTPPLLPLSLFLTVDLPLVHISFSPQVFAVSKLKDGGHDIH